MPRVSIRIPTPLRPFVDGRASVEVEARTAGEALARLTEDNERLRAQLYGADGELRSFVNVYVGDSNLRDLTGDTAAGATVYTSSSCCGCHCADAVGGCAMSAPSLVGVSLDLLDANLRGSDSHPLKPTLTDQELVDLQAWLSSL